MAITLKESSGGSYPEGWQSVTVSKAEKGAYNGSLYYDLWFESYPDNLKCRVWEAKNQDGEEFSIANMFRYSNPEILEENESDGKKSISIDDSPMALVGKKLQAFFYKNANGYTEVSQKVVPASGKPSINRVLLNVNNFLAECFDENGEYLQDTIYRKEPSQKNCKYCEFKNKPELCDRKR